MTVKLAKSHFGEGIVIWQLVDTTYAGRNSMRNGYVEGVGPGYDFYFLPEHSALVSTHSPVDEKWRLLDMPISRGEHEPLPIFSDG